MTSYYRYTLSSFDILLPESDVISVPAKHVQSIGIEKDFDNDFFPILYMSINLSPDIYYKIMSNKTTVRFRVRMDKYLYGENNTSSFKYLVFNEIFTIFPDDNNVFLDAELYKKTKDVVGDIKQSSDFSQSYQFYLFNEKDLMSSKKIINTVVSDNNMMNIVTYLLSTAGFSDVLMSPFDNNSTYNEVPLLPVSILDNLNYLDAQYGFYNYGKLVFFDFTTNYFIDKRAKCTAYRPNEYTDVRLRIYKTTSSDSMSSGSYKDDVDKFYGINVSQKNITMSTSSIVSNQLHGNTILSINTSDGNVNTISPDTQHRGDSSQQIVINNFNNPYTNKSMEYRKIENDNIIDISFYDVDLDCLAPNKRFLFSFEDSAVHKTHGGEYRLSKALFDFKKDGEGFKLVGTANFRNLK